MIIDLNEIYTFKLLTGEEFVAKVAEIHPTYYIVKQPISTVISPQGLQMMPMLFSASHDHNMQLNTHGCAMIAVPREDVKNSYIEATTGLKISKQLITG